MRGAASRRSASGAGTPWRWRSSVPERPQGFKTDDPFVLGGHSLVASWLYLAGTVVIVAGFGLLRLWMKAVVGRPSEAPEHVLAIAAVTFLLGAMTVVAAIALDTEPLQFQSTRLFTYRVSVDLTDVDSTRLLLPAPLDPRVHGALNRTIGTASLRLVQGSGGLAVEVFATEDVTFDVRYEFVDEPFNRTLTRFTPPAPPNVSGATQARIDLSSLGGEDVHVALRIEFREFCLSTLHELDALLASGSFLYPVASTVTSC